MTPLLVALGAAVGSVLRYLAAAWMDRDVPLGTLAVNVAGSFLLGAFSAMALSEEVIGLLGVGFCGGLTTYSAFAVGVHRRGWSGGPAYAASTVVLALAACALGWSLYA